MFPEILTVQRRYWLKVTTHTQAGNLAYGRKSHRWPGAITRYARSSPDISFLWLPAFDLTVRTDARYFLGAPTLGWIVLFQPAFSFCSFLAEAFQVFRGSLSGFFLFIVEEHGLGFFESALDKGSPHDNQELSPPQQLSLFNPVPFPYIVRQTQCSSVNWKRGIT